MQTMTILFLLAALCLIPRTEAQPECMAREPADKKRCFEDLDLDLTVMPQNLEVLMPAYESYETFFTIMDPNVHCQDPVRYRQALGCSINVTRQCLDPDGTKKMAPAFDDVVTGMQRLCDLKDQVNSECFKTFFNAAMDCLTYIMPTLRLNMRTISEKELTCKTADLTYDCVEVLTKPMCGENSTNIYLAQLGKYQLPEICKNESESTRPRERYFQQLRDDVDDNRSYATAIFTATTVTTTTATTIAIHLLLAMLSAHRLSVLFW